MNRQHYRLFLRKATNVFVIAKQLVICTFTQLILQKKVESLSNKGVFQYVKSRVELSKRGSFEDTCEKLSSEK